MSLLQLQQISKQFGGVSALSNLSMEVAEGSIHGVIGPNGAGKTTLISIIAGFERPTSGSILFEQRDITALPVFRRVRCGIARTFQIPQPFTTLTLLENIMIPLLQRMSRSAAERRAGEIAERLLLGTELEQQVQTLPVGTLKLLELARAIATQPRLLLVDEPMGGLGADRMAGMIRLLQGIRDEGVTIVLVEHVMQAVVALADQLTVLNFGQLLAQGAPNDLLRMPEVIEAYLGADHA